MFDSSDFMVRFAQAVIRTRVKEGKQLTWSEFKAEAAGEVPPETDRVMTGPAAGVFVSLHMQDRLRGCIGTIEPVTDSMAEEMASTAVAACTADPRFPPVRPGELDRLEINVDILSRPEPYDGPVDWDVRRHGVIVTGSDGRKGLLLPDLDGVDTAQEQKSIAARKAGLHDSEILSVFLFEVQRHT